MRFQFFKYAVTGSSAVVLDMCSLFILKEYAGMRPVLAVIINQLFIINYVFFLNKYWSFQSFGMTGRQMLRFIIVACLNYSIAISWMWFFSDQLSVNYLLARILNIAVAVSWNFLLYKYFVYSKPVPVNAVNNQPVVALEEVVD